MASAARKGLCNSANLAFMLFMLLLCTARGIPTDDQNIDYPDMLSIFQKLAQLSPTNYDIYVQDVGAVLQEMDGMSCNPLSTTPVCRSLAADEGVRLQCPRSDPTVDCIYIGEHGVDPKSLLSSQAWAPPQDSCPTCFDKLQELWCGLQVPKCGAFGGLMKGTMISAAMGPVQAQANNQSYAFVAFQEATEKIVTALSARLLPCREWCEELVSSCSCGADRDDTLGSLVEYAKKLRLVDDGTYQLTFSTLWTRPFCSLLLSKNDPRFSGTCSTFATGGGSGSSCAQRDRWCAVADTSKVTNVQGETIDSGSGQPGPVGDAVMTLTQAMVVAQIVENADDLLTDDLAAVVMIQNVPGLRMSLEALPAAAAEADSQGTAAAAEADSQGTAAAAEADSQGTASGAGSASLDQQQHSRHGLSGGVVAVIVICAVAGSLAGVALAVVGVRILRQNIERKGGSWYVSFIQLSGGDDV